MYAQIEENDIAVVGFSAGGILGGELVLNFDGTINETAIDSDYIPDELDRISADVSAVGMVYSFYGRLSVASTDVEKFKASDLPPSYFVYGTRDMLCKVCLMVLVPEMVSGYLILINGWPEFLIISMHS